MAARKVLPVDSAVETTKSETPKTKPDEDVTAAPAPKPRTWTHDGIDVKQSCAIVAAVYLLLFALAWYGNRHARSAAAAEATTNTPEPKRKVIPELV